MEKNTKTNPWIIFSIAVVVSLAFVGLIGFLSPQLVRFEKPVDQGSWWYYWQLAYPTMWTALSAWGLYIAHQVFAWIMVYRLIKEGLHHQTITKNNLIALWGNLAFMVLHLVQTHLFYDGTAQDVPVWSSQWSVIIMLVLVIFLLIPRRGIVFGLDLPLQKRLYLMIRKYHGFYMSWALVYTFWFHPMEGDIGLLTGFFYMFLLFIQMSFAGTKIHRAIGWIVALELMVGIHGPAISIQKMLATGLPLGFAGSWPMFAFGFLMVFMLTGQFGFKLKWPWRLVILGIFIGALVLVYSNRGFHRLYEILFIPGALIGGAFVLALISNLLSWKTGRVPRTKPGAP